MAPISVPTDFETSESSIRQKDDAGTRLFNPSPNLRVIFTVTVFTAAFLLFFVELLLGKLMLAGFGGAPAVWTSCLLVFQVLCSPATPRRTPWLRELGFASFDG
jgi:hypothetical protein